MDGISPESLFSALDAVEDQAVLVSVPDLRIVHANRDYLAAAGMSLEEARGLNCHKVSHDLDHPCDPDGHPCPARITLETGASSSAVHLHKGKNGEEFLVDVSSRAIRDNSGKIVYVMEVIRRLDEQKRLHEDLKRKTGFLEKILETCPDGIVGNDPRGNIFLFNEGAERIFGYKRSEVIGKIRAKVLYPPGGAREVRDYIHSEQYGGRGRLVDFETVVLGGDGRRIPIRLSCCLIHEDGREAGVIGFFSDITERRALQERFLESEERFRGIFETAHDAMINIGEDGRILLANKSAEKLAGFDKGGMVGVEFVGLFPERYARCWNEIRTYMFFGSAGASGMSVELHVLRRSGEEVPVHMSLAEKVVKEKRILTAIIRDISERKAMEEELRVLSVTDSLTHLYNRRHFQSLAQKEEERARRGKGRFCLLLIDVDNFKRYNDTYGHAEGDIVLRTVGELVKKTIRAADSGFRFGGEEFAVLLPDTTSEQAMLPSERLRVRIAETPFRPSGHRGPVVVTVSIGIAESAPNRTLDDIIRFADMAMYAAKNGGRNRTIVYDSIKGRASDPSR